MAEHRFGPLRSNPERKNRLITEKPSSGLQHGRMGNPVGSRLTYPGTVEEAYFVGLWRADGYSWTSSIGISNTDPRLAKWTSDFLTKICGPIRVRWRVYLPVGIETPPSWLGGIGRPYVVRPVQKARRVSYHVYVNHRPFLRQVKQWVSRVDRWPAGTVWPYFAGRFDGDGHISKNGRWGVRIAYGTSIEAQADQAFLARVGRMESRVYRFRAARMSVLYILKRHRPVFLNAIRPFSVKLNGELDPVETESAAKGGRGDGESHQTPVPPRSCFDSTQRIKTVGVMV